MPQEMGMNAGATIKLHAFDEGQETAEFYEAIGSRNHRLFYSLLKGKRILWNWYFVHIGELSVENIFLTLMVLKTEYSVRIRWIL